MNAIDVLVDLGGNEGNLLKHVGHTVDTTWQAPAKRCESSTLISNQRRRRRADYKGPLPGVVARTYPSPKQC